MVVVFLQSHNNCIEFLLAITLKKFHGGQTRVYYNILLANRGSLLFFISPSTSMQHAKKNKQSKYCGSSPNFFPVVSEVRLWYELELYLKLTHVGWIPRRCNFAAGFLYCIVYLTGASVT